MKRVRSVAEKLYDSNTVEQQIQERLARKDAAVQGFAEAEVEAV
jgi:hypothetical protein